MLPIILKNKSGRRECRSRLPGLFSLRRNGEQRLGEVNDLEVAITSRLYQVTLSCGEAERQVAFEWLFYPLVY